MTVGPLARQRHEQLPGSHGTRVDGGAADGTPGPGDDASAADSGEIVSRERGLRGVPGSRGGRLDVGHGRQCRTGTSHRSAVAGTVAGPVPGAGAGVDNRPGVVIAS